MNHQFYHSEKWDQLREEALRYYGECAQCATTHNLTVHHKNYKNFGGNEKIEDLEVLCASCHQLLHETEDTYWINVINRLESLKEDFEKGEEGFIFTKKPKEKLKIEIEKLKKLLETRKIVQGMDFIIVHNCHICRNSEKDYKNKIKCKKPGQYSCYPSSKY